MLSLPNGWRSCSAQHIVRELLLQADAKSRYAEAARAITLASLEFMLSGPRWANHLKETLLPWHQNGWRLNDRLFYVLPRVDDEAIDELANPPRFRGSVDLITPPWAARLVRHGVRAIKPTYHMDVYPIDTYVDLRLLFTGLDMKMPTSDVLADFLRRYANLVHATTEIDFDPV